MKTFIPCTLMPPPKSIHLFFNLIQECVWQSENTHNIRRNSLKDRLDHDLPAYFGESLVTPTTNFLPHYILNEAKSCFFFLLRPTIAGKPRYFLVPKTAHTPRILVMTY